MPPAILDDIADLTPKAEEPLLAKPEWGTKRICPSCGARYYDLMHDPIVCPRCSTPFDPEALLRARRRHGGGDRQCRGGRTLSRASQHPAGAIFPLLRRPVIPNLPAA